MRKKLTAVICAVVAPMLSGCLAAVVAAGAGGAAAINDSRTIGALAEDEGIENKLIWRIADKFRDSVHIGVTSYNRRVLLIGQAPNEETKQEVLAMVKAVENVRSIVDHIEIGNPSSLTARTADSWLTARVKTALCGVRQEGFSCLNIKVVTEKGVLYLLGLVGREEASVAIEKARRVPGVINVVKVFEYR
ncbi:MAG: BON domain-containing protein [Gammaproteobacteria bacterium]